MTQYLVTQPITKFLFSASACAVLAACGGGDGGSEAPPPAPVIVEPSNAAPVIANMVVETVLQENFLGEAFTVDATDADNDTLSYAITGGDSAGLGINRETGVVEIIERLDFENSTDANGDNSYSFTVTVDDGNGGTASAEFTIRVTDEAFPEDGLLRELRFESVDAVRDLEFAPGLFADAFYASDYTDDTGMLAADRPLIILASGGGFIRENRRSVEDIAVDFAQRGWVAATIDYRTLNRFPRNEAELQVAATQAVHDMFAAVRSARADSGFLSTLRPGGGSLIDSERIVVGGESAGGVMAVTAAALDPDDEISAEAIRNYIADNGGVFGDVGEFDDESSSVAGAFPLSGAVFDLAIIDAETAPTFGAHEEDDFVVPCRAGQEGATGVRAEVVGTCDFVPDMVAKGVAADSVIIADDAGHVAYSDAERADIYNRAADFLVTELYSLADAP